MNPVLRIFKVTGMTCGHCKAAVESAIRQVSGVGEVCVDLAAGQATVIGDASDERIEVAIKEAGYESQAVA
jgi:copper chaperone